MKLNSSYMYIVISNKICLFYQYSDTGLCEPLVYVIISVFVLDKFGTHAKKKLPNFNFCSEDMQIYFKEAQNMS